MVDSILTSWREEASTQTVMTDDQHGTITPVLAFGLRQQTFGED